MLSGGKSGQQPDYPHQLVNPMMVRVLSPFESTRFKMQNWNLVFMPYCSADMHQSFNNRLSLEDEAQPLTSRTRYEQYAGLPNVMAMMGFLRSNLPAPAQVYLTGQSAGSYAASVTQPIIRRYLAPTSNMYTLADAWFPHDTLYLSDKALGASAGMSPAQKLDLIDERRYPAGRAFKRIYENVFGYEQANPQKRTGLKFLKEILPGMDSERLMSVMGEYHRTYPDARSSYVMAENDQVIGQYVYGTKVQPGNPSVMRLPQDSDLQISFSSPVSRQRSALLNQDLDALQKCLDGVRSERAGYFLPSGRRLLSAHLLTGLTYTDTRNGDTGHDIKDVITNLVSRDAPALLRERERDRTRGINATPTGILRVIDLFAGGTLSSAAP